jgi:hypothetical protein
VVDHELEDLPDDGSLDLVGFELVAALGQRVAVGCEAPDPLALGSLRRVPDLDALDERVAFELREHAEHVQQHLPHRVGRVDRLGRRPEHDAGLVQLAQKFDHRGHRPAETVDAVDE